MDDLKIFLATIFLMIIVTLVMIGLSKSKKENEKLEKLDDNFIKNANISHDDYFFGQTHLNGIAISELDKKLHLFERQDLKSEYEIKTFEFMDILESAIVEDGQTLTKTSKGGLIGGSLLGGVIAGGVGSLIGAMSSNKTSTEQVKKVKLSIVVDNILNPIHDIVFLTSHNSINKNNQKYIIDFQKCNTWHKRVSIIIKRNENLINK